MFLIFVSYKDYKISFYNLSVRYKICLLLAMKEQIIMICLSKIWFVRLILYSIE